MPEEIKEAPTEPKGNGDKASPPEGGAQPKEDVRSKISEGIAPDVPKEAQNASSTAQPQTAGESAEGTFLSNDTKIDPQKLPDELKPIYNSMLSDYKSKTRELGEMRGTVTQEMKEQAIQDALDNLDGNQFQSLTQHPKFVRELVDYLQKQGVQPGQNQTNQQTDAEEVDLDSMTDTERTLYEKNKSLESKLDKITSQMDQINQTNQNASINSQDANLRGKYGQLYNPDSVNQFLGDVQAGKRTLSREDIFKIIDYQGALNRSYEWGKRDSYEGSREKENASMLSGMMGGGETGYEVPKQQPKEHLADYMMRLAENGKKHMVEGKKSPYIRNA